MIKSLKTDLPVNSYDEWTQLQEVIVGNVGGFPGFHLDNSFNLFYWDNIRPYLAKKGFFKNGDGEYEWPVIEVERQILDELEEDLQALVEALEGADVIVRRPASLVGEPKIAMPFWRSVQSPPLNVRDQTIILGSTIVETAPHVRARLFENCYLKPLFYEYFKKGAGWICMPQPSLAAGVFDSTFFHLSDQERDALQEHQVSQLPGLGKELIFDGAQCIRLGIDVLVNVANENHELGFQWLSAFLGDTFNFHRLHRMADSHLDSIILPLRDGLWLVRDRRYIDLLPTKFRTWDFIVAPEVERDLFPSYERNNLSIASQYIDMNVLSVNQDTVIVNELYPEMIKLLESRGFHVLPVVHRHRRLFGGGFHCFTLDVRRSGGLEAYG